MIHDEPDGSFIFVTESNQRLDVDMNMEHAPDGCCTISAGQNAASQAYLNARELREFIVKLEGVEKQLRRAGRVPA